MARSVFVPVAGATGVTYRFDTASGSSTPAAISPVDELGVPIAGSSLTAAAFDGFLPKIVGPDAVTTLYQKALGYDGSVLSVFATLTALPDLGTVGSAGGRTAGQFVVQIDASGVPYVDTTV